MKSFLSFLALAISAISAQVLVSYNAQNPLVIGAGPEQMTYFPGGDDGTFNVQGNKMVLTSNPYVKTVAPSPGGTLDHVKWLAYINTAFTIPTDGKELVLTVKGTSEIFGTKKNPFCVSRNDPRLASIGINTLDLTTNIVADFFITNDKIYALYERLPFARTAENNYASFTYLVPVADRKNKCDDFKLQIAFNGKSKYLRFLVDGKEVLRVEKLGFRLTGFGADYLVLDLAGVEQEAFPVTIQAGFGTFSLLDAYSACTKTICNGVLRKCPRSKKDQGLVKLVTTPNFYFFPGTNKPATFVSDGVNPETRIFGQGAQLKLCSLSVSINKAPRKH